MGKRDLITASFPPFLLAFSAFKPLFKENAETVESGEQTARRMTKHNEGSVDKYHSEGPGEKSRSCEPGKVTRPRFRMMLKRKCKMQSGTRGEEADRGRVRGYDVDTKRAPFAPMLYFSIRAALAGYGTRNGKRSEISKLEQFLPLEKRANTLFPI